MKIMQKVSGTVNAMQEGITFQYRNLSLERSEFGSAAKAIERLIRKGVIKRVSSGTFYKPQQSAFGELRPREEELLKPYLFENGKRVAYITGGSLYNRMGLTTQVPNTLKVACWGKRIVTRVGDISVKSVKSYVEVTNENYVLLEILDAIKDFNAISDLDQVSALAILKTTISGLSKSECAKLIRLALRYPPRTRALLGAILDTNKTDQSLILLQQSLNPLTMFRFDRIFDLLPTATAWNIRRNESTQQSSPP